MADFHEVYYIDGRKAIKLTAYAKIINYSDKYLLEIIKNLFKKRIYIAYKWKRNYYVFLPEKPPQNTTSPKEFTEKPKTVETPSGDELEVNWDKAVKESPTLVAGYLSFSRSFVIGRDKKLYLVSPDPSSTLTPKTGAEPVGVQNATYPATTGYSYGNYIFYDPTRMSIFDPGTGGTLKSTQIPQAFFEVCRALDAAENTRNGANPGLPPRRNLSTTVSFDTGTVAVAATIPIITSIQSDGTIKVSGSDYLGSTYSSFNNGGGDLTSTNIVAAFLETASLLSSAEKGVVPVENQPNNIQIVIDTEAGNATISANLPFTTAAANNGDVTVIAIDYL